MAKGKKGAKKGRLRSVSLKAAATSSLLPSYGQVNPSLAILASDLDAIVAAGSDALGALTEAQLKKAKKARDKVKKMADDTSPDTECIQGYSPYR